jgi:hypothetical protein
MGTQGIDVILGMN